MSSTAYTRNTSSANPRNPAARRGPEAIAAATAALEAVANLHESVRTGLADDRFILPRRRRPHDRNGDEHSPSRVASLAPLSGNPRGRRLSDSSGEMGAQGWKRPSIGQAGSLLGMARSEEDRQPMSYRLEIRKHQGARQVRDFVAAFVDHPALRRIVEASNGSWPTGSLEEQVAELHNFSARWDFRGGAERLDLAAATDLNKVLIVTAAEELGMAAAVSPVSSHYDHGLALGGTALASIYRVQRLFELRSDATIEHPAILTSLRAIGDQELDLVRARAEIADLVQSVETEFDVMVRAAERFVAERASVKHQPDPNPHLASATASVGDALVLAAPSGEPDRRANTRDNYDVYSSRIGDSDAVLIVTSSIYLPYQFFIALQALGWEKPRTIEIIGFPPGWMRGVLTGPANVLQELRSALYGAMKTLEAMAA
jgi:hypothetical protein